MKKSILIIGLFSVIAMVALVYAFQSKASGSIPLTVKRYLPVRLDTPQPPQDPNTNVLFEWKLGNPYILKGSGGNVFLDLQVTGKALPDTRRKPLNLVLVIDRSGSMGSENKLDQVKDAAASIVQQMNPTDRLAIVIYDDIVHTIVPSSPVENKDRLREAIYSLTPGGSTNLYAGLQEGAGEVLKHQRNDCVNRIILLSDGLANVGITDPSQIAAEVKRIRGNSVSVSTMGVGVDYNENLMANIADHSGGNYYYISSQTNMAEVFRKEWNLMQSVIATNAKAVMQLEKGVDVVDVAGFKWEKLGRTLTIQVPDVYSGETKRILVELRAPADAEKVVRLANGKFLYTDLSGGKPRAVAKDFHPAIKVVQDRQLVQNNENSQVRAKAASVQASRTVLDAYAKWESGDKNAAEEMVSEAVSNLKALGYVETAPQADRYNKFLQMLNTPAAEAPAVKLDELKKQKEAERKAQQTSPQ